MEIMNKHQMPFLKTAIAGVFALLLCVGVTPSFAAPQYALDCNSCHGTPPVDSAGTRDINTGRFAGNHATHSRTADKNVCEKCHGAGATSFGTSHLDGKIGLSTNINGSSPAALYKGIATGFTNQTSVPTLGSCTNVSCHFNAPTPSWGGAAFAAPANCNSCHALAPGGSHPTGTNKHATYYGTTTSSCVNCHVNHAAEVQPFEHATSALRSIDVRFTQAPNAGSGAPAYTGGNITYPSYLAGTGAGNCSNIYCHSDGTKVGATLTANGTATWGGAVTCASCHKYNGTDAAAIATGRHTIHVGSTTGYSFTCNKCHSATTANGSTISAVANHVDKNVNVLFNSMTAGKLGTYAGANVRVAGGAAANCANIYCHSDGTKASGTFTGANVTPAWSGAGASCAACHGDSTTLATGGHAKHVSAAGYSLTCNLCHSATASNNSTISNKANHANYAVDVTPSTGSYNANGHKPGVAAGSCNNVYCHSDGAGTNNAISWTAGVLACSACHGNPPSHPTENSHSNHAAIGCQFCHNATTTDGVTITAKANHTNGVWNISPNAGTTFTVTNTPAVGTPATCSNISCHGGSTSTTATWGVALNCFDCHGNGATPSVLTYAAGFATDNVLTAKIQMTGPGSWATAGHGLLSGNYPGTQNAAAGFGSTGKACEYCHDSTVGHKVATNPFRLLNQADATWQKNGVCMSCHATGSAGVNVAGLGLKNSTSKVGSTHFGTAHTGGNGGGRYCWDCHNGHGSGAATASHAMIREKLALTNDLTTTNYGIPLTFTANVTYTKSSVAGAGSDFVNASFTGICQACHSGVAHYTQTNFDTAHNYTSSCISCHTHTGTTALNAFVGKNCDDCHGYPPVPRNIGWVSGTNFAAAGNYINGKFEDYSGGGGAHVADAHVLKTADRTAGWANCTKCHADGPSAHNTTTPVRANVTNVSVKLATTVRSKFSNGAQMTYSSAKLVAVPNNKTGTCYNTACHFKPSPKWSNLSNH